MSNEIDVFNPAAVGLPAELASVFDVDALAGDLTEGAGDGFQVLSIRGSKWRVKSGGEEHPLLNENDEPVPSIEAVILKGSKAVSKIYYKDSYSEGDNEAPDCFSVDGMTPDPSSTDVQCKSCTACPHNVWGSRMTEAGKKAKECADNRRMSVWLHTRAPDGTDDTEPMLLRVPAASIKDLATYGNSMHAKGYPYNALVTRIGFDLNAAYPKLTFKPVRPITNDEAEIVQRMFNSDATHTILNTTGENAAPAITDDSDAVSTEFEQPVAEEKPAKAPKKKAASKKAAAAKKGNGKAKEEPAAPAAVTEDADLNSIIENLADLSLG